MSCVDCRKNRDGIIAKIDDDMLRHYCNEDVFLMQVRHSFFSITQIIHQFTRFSSRWWWRRVRVVRRTRWCTTSHSQKSSQPWRRTPTRRPRSRCRATPYHPTTSSVCLGGRPSPTKGLPALGRLEMGILMDARRRKLWLLCHSNTRQHRRAPSAAAPELQIIKTVVSHTHTYSAIIMRAIGTRPSFLSWFLATRLFIWLLYQIFSSLFSLSSRRISLCYQTRTWKTSRLMWKVPEICRSPKCTTTLGEL